MVKSFSRAAVVLGAVLGGLAARAVPPIVPEMRATVAGAATEVHWTVDDRVGFAAFDLQRWSEKRQVFETVARLDAVDPFAMSSEGAAAMDVPMAVGTEVWYRLRGLTSVNTWLDLEPVRVRVGHAPRAPAAAVPPPAAAPAPLAASGTGALIRIAVTNEGLYKLTLSDIADRLSGWTTGDVAQAIASTNLALTSGGQPVAWLPAQDGILFYGEGVSRLNRYTAQNIYWLTPGSGLAMAVRGGIPPSPVETNRTFVETLHIEQDVPDKKNHQVYTNATDDFWFWDAAQPPRSNSFKLRLPGVAPSGGSAVVTANLQGWFQQEDVTNNHVVMYVNGLRIAEGRFPGCSHYLLTGEATNLVAGTNTVIIQPLKDAGVSNTVVLIESFDVSYPRLLAADANELSFRPAEGAGVGARSLTASASPDPAPRAPPPHPFAVTVTAFTSPEILVFDLRDPLRPVWISGTAVQAATDGTYRVAFDAIPDTNRYYAVAGSRTPAGLTGMTPADLVSATNEADHLIVTVPEFVATAEPLAQQRRAQGLISRIITVDDIYAAFSHGMVTPDAIGDFLRHAAQHWARAPRWVVLAGAGTWDYRRKNSTRADDPCLIPPALIWVHDPAIPGAQFDGEWTGVDNPLADVDGDGLIDIAIGRLPVADTNELAGAITKVLAYEQAGEWKWRVMFCADNPETNNEFDVSCERLRAWISADYDVTTNYLTAAPGDNARVKPALTNALSAGLGLLLYMGHGVFSRLAGERLLVYEYLQNDDIGGLTNAGAPAVFFGGTCEIANFSSPLSPWVGARQSLGEHMVKRVGGGMAAAWSAVTLSYNTAGEAILGGALRSWFADWEPRLGTVVRQGLTAYSRDPLVPYLLRTMCLLGDPAMVLAPPGFSYHEWRTAHFDPAQLNDPAISGGAGDPDADGRSNLAEYFGRTSPTNAEWATELEPAGFDDLTDYYAGASFDRAKWTEGASATPEVSWDLIGGLWTNGSEFVEYVATNRLDRMLERVEFRIKPPVSSNSPVFIRMRYDETP